MARSATTYARARRPMPPTSAPAPIWMRDDRSLALVATLVWVVVLRVVVPGFFDYSEDDVALIQNGGSIGNQIIWLSLVLIPLILLRNRIKLTWMLLSTVNGWFLLLTLYACASVLWSIDSGATIRKLSHLIGIYVVCITVCLVGWNARRFQAVLRPVLTAIMVGSIIFGLVRPDLAIAGPNLAAGDPGGHWRGLTIHKNALGSVSSFAAILWFHAFLYRDTKWWAIVVGLASSLACLYLSGSSTSLVGTLMVIVFLLLGKLTPPSMRSHVTPVVITALLITIICYGLAVMKLVPGLDALISSATSAVGKDATFAGRTPIWDLVKANIALHPLLGTGYGAFWVGPFDTSPSYEFFRRLYFYPGEAHNGYLDIVLDLGYVGLVLLGGFIVRYFVLSNRLLKIDRSQALLYLSLMFYFLLANLAESSWLTVGPNPNWIMVGLAVVAMSRQLLDQRLHAAHGDPQAAATAAPQKSPAADDLARRYRSMTRRQRR
ncbi:MAG TPA: O-antigen ligase family protein [Steroidobacteraceae bacterium]|nr:O-antigen ligase family protein [Steroidobacteraceae bacterium]